MSDLPPLAEFLRSQRERIAPEQVGLTSNGRRRTPGLRREEVATLAGVSIDYLVRLEQGRDANPSNEVLFALADALQLDPTETQHLLALKTVGNSPQMERFCPAVPSLESVVAPTVQALLDRLHPSPAHIVGAAGDVVASNPAWRALVGPLGLHDGANWARHVFDHPEAYLDWAEVADAEVARLRGVQLFLRDDERLAELIDGLNELPGFAERWNGRPAPRADRGRLRLHHPDLGEVSFDYEIASLATDDHQLVCWLPADAATAAALDGLAAEVPVSPAQLRLVGDV